MGGHVFEDICTSIKSEDIDNVLKHYMIEFRKLFPLADIQYELLGSAKKKPMSGDIDLGIDYSYFYNNFEDNVFDIFHINKKEFDLLVEKLQTRSKTSTLEMLKQKAFLTLIANYIREHSIKIIVEPKKTTIGNIFTCFPQGNGKYVQIDLCIGKIDWIRFAYASDAYEGNIKGLHRTQLILSMFVNKGKVFNHISGIKDKVSNEFDATDPNTAVKLLNNLYNTNFTLEGLYNYNTVYKYVKDLNDNKIFDIFLSILDSTRCDIPNNLQEYWINNQKRLNLEGKFLPTDSKILDTINKI